MHGAKQVVVALISLHKYKKTDKERIREKEDRKRKSTEGGKMKEGGGREIYRQVNRDVNRMPQDNAS